MCSKEKINITNLETDRESVNSKNDSGDRGGSNPSTAPSLTEPCVFVGEISVQFCEIL